MKNLSEIDKISIKTQKISEELDYWKIKYKSLEKSLISSENSKMPQKENFMVFLKKINIFTKELWVLGKRIRRN